MKKESSFVVILILVAACVVLVFVNRRTGKKLSAAGAELARYRKAVADLESRAEDAESQQGTASDERRALRREIAALLEQRREDSLVIERLWRALQTNVRGGEKEVRYDGEEIKKLLAAADGDLEKLLGRIVTSEGITSTLEEHSGEPTYWVAAASLVQDENAALKYLEDAASLYPKSAVVLSALVEALMAKGEFDEATMAHIATLKEVDPANSLSDYYEANCRFQNGDIEGALQSLAEASLKDRFADSAMDLLMARYDYLLNEGCSDATAMGLSAFTLPLSNMAMLRDIGRRSMEQARELISTGQNEYALRIADAVVRTGKNISSSGRFLIYDLVGISLQELALTEQRRIYEGLGNAFRIEEIDSQLQSLKERSSVIKVMGSSFGETLQSMTEEEIADYVERTIRNGELSALRDMPGVAEALERARK